MQRQHTKLGRLVVTRGVRLPAGDAASDHDIAQIGASRRRAGARLTAPRANVEDPRRAAAATLARLARERRRGTGGTRGRKTEHVGRVVVTQILAVQRPDACVAYERDADDAAGTGRRHARQPACEAAGRNRPPALIGHEDGQLGQNGVG